MAGKALRTAILASCVIAGASFALAAEGLPATTAAPVEMPSPPHLTLMLIRDPEVQDELKLKLKQAVAADAAVAKVDLPLWRLRDVSPAECGPQLDSLLATLHADLAKSLKPDQLRRLEQLVMQARGPRAVMAPDLAERLELSGDQLANLTRLTRSASDGKLDVRKILQVLSPQQQHQLQLIYGERFDLAKIKRVGCVAPELRAMPAWINSDPLTLKKQRGKVVVLHFWAFGCVNCQRNLPHYQSWYQTFPKSELSIIGIHTPETAAESDLGQLRAQVAQRRIAYPVAFDAEAHNWQAWANNVWPAVYLIDKRGQVRSWWYGELNWQGADGEARLRKQIASLLAE